MGQATAGLTGTGADQFSALLALPVLPFGWLCGPRGPFASSLWGGV